MTKVINKFKNVALAATMGAFVLLGMVAVEPTQAHENWDVNTPIQVVDKDYDKETQTLSVDFDAKDEADAYYARTTYDYNAFDKDNKRGVVTSTLHEGFISEGLYEVGISNVPCTKYRINLWAAHTTKHEDDVPHTSWSEPTTFNYLVPAENGYSCTKSSNLKKLAVQQKPTSQVEQINEVGIKYNTCEALLENEDVGDLTKEQAKAWLTDISGKDRDKDGIYCDLQRT